MRRPGTDATPTACGTPGDDEGNEGAHRAATARARAHHTARARTPTPPARPLRAPPYTIPDPVDAPPPLRAATHLPTPRWVSLFARTRGYTCVRGEIPTLGESARLSGCVDGAA